MSACRLMDWQDGPCRTSTASSSFLQAAVDELVEAAVVAGIISTHLAES